MSIYYDVKEHLKVTGESEIAEETTKIMRQQLAALASRVLLDDAVLHHLTVTTEVFSADLSDGVISADFKKALDALIDPVTADVFVDYTYRWSALNDHLRVGPFVMTDYLNDHMEEIPDDVFYAVYNYADSSVTGEGVLSAYGTDEHGIYRDGPVFCEPTQELPEDGYWYAEWDTVSYETGDTEGLDLYEIERVCQRLCDLSEFDYDELTVSETGVHFSLNNTVLHTGEQIRRFMDLCGELVRLTGNKCKFHTVFTDENCPGSRLRKMQMDFAPDGTCTLSYAEV